MHTSNFPFDRTPRLAAKRHIQSKKYLINVSSLNASALVLKQHGANGLYFDDYTIILSPAHPYSGRFGLHIKEFSGILNRKGKSMLILCHEFECAT